MNLMAMEITPRMRLYSEATKTAAYRRCQLVIALAEALAEVCEAFEDDHVPDECDCPWCQYDETTYRDIVILGGAVRTLGGVVGTHVHELKGDALLPDDLPARLRKLAGLMEAVASEEAGPDEPTVIPAN